jgi:hypothetical protein
MRYWIVAGFLRGEVNAFWLAKGRFMRSARNVPRSGDTGYLSAAISARF